MTDKENVFWNVAEAFGQALADRFGKNDAIVRMLKSESKPNFVHAFTVLVSNNISASMIEFVKLFNSVEFQEEEKDELDGSYLLSLALFNYQAAIVNK